MQAVDEEPVETIHLYVVREEEPRPSLLPVILSTLVLLALLAIGVFIPYKPLYIQKTIRVPAVLLPLQTFTTSVAVIPTGSKTYPASTAHGTLTITNGSVITEELPKGLIFTGKDGREVTTDAAVFIPAGSADGYGVAAVSAHAVVAGEKGNIAALDINQVYGTSLYIRNLQRFTGGNDAYSVTFATAQDRQHALTQARHSLIQHTLAGLLQSPCTETVTGSDTLHVSWTCQLVTYETPHLLQIRVLHAQVVGKTILLDIVFIARPRILTTK